MSRFWHMLIFFCYVTVASALAVLGTKLFPGVGQITSILLGAVVVLGCALLQETYIRRMETVKSLRRLLLLKRALDHSRAELALARDEIRRLFEAVEDGGGDRVLAALDRLTETDRARTATAPDPEPEPNRKGGSRPVEEHEAEARSLLERMALTEAEAAPANRPQRPDRAAASDRAMREASSEVRVLHNLVEQLYAGRDKPPVSLSEGSTRLQRPAEDPREPTLGRARSQQTAEADVFEEERTAAGGGFGRAIRGGLRVVSDAAGGGRGRREETPMASREDAALLSTVREALKEDRVDLYLQPIVSLPQRKRRYYECFSRVRAANGDVVGPDRYIPVAKQAGLLSAIDNMLLFRCVQLLRKLRRKDFSAAFFCNISPHTLSDREFFKDFIEYMESHAELAPNLVLEFSQTDLGDDLEVLARDLDRLGGLGYRFSLDGVSDLDLDLDALEARHFAFIKVEAASVLRRLNNGGAEAAELRALKQTLDGRGIDLIVDRIETEATLVELLDFNIDFGQGYLFGEPRLSKDPGT